MIKGEKGDEMYIELLKGRLSQKTDDLLGSMSSEGLTFEQIRHPTFMKV